MTSRPAKSNKHTYGSRNRSRPALLPSSPRSSDSLFDNEPVPSVKTSLSSPSKRKRPLESAFPTLYDSILPPTKKIKPLIASKKENRPASTQSRSTTKSSRSAVSSSSSSLTQLHLSLAASTIRTCTLCKLSYTRGAPEDERLHKGHCQRVTRGLEWGREEEKASGMEVVETGVRLKGGLSGRIIEVKSDVKGRLGVKLGTLYDTINVTLSSPPVPVSTLSQSKSYIFLVPSGTPHREKMVGCVIASRIETAMQIVKPDEGADAKANIERGLVWVDGEDDAGLYCDPAPLPTPMGIPRLFVASEYRHKGIASSLLSAAAKHFIHGCQLDPAKGEVAFSQPTGDGRGVMLAWGKGRVRIFEE